jgi:hypothetical protein
MSFSFTDAVENLIFGNRRAIIGAFVVGTVFMAYSARNLHIDAGFTKLLPLEHEYMQTFVKYRQEFGGADRVLIALMVKEGDIFTPRFFETLKNATDDVFFIPGVDRTRVSSLFTPDVRFTEVVEDGISGGNVVPDDFRLTPEGLDQVRKNILKAGIVGRLVANDFSGAMISAQLLEIDPNTGERLDYVAVARLLEERIREKYQPEGADVAVAVHMIGFAKVVGDIADGVPIVAIFATVTLALTFLFVWYHSQSLRIALVRILVSLVAVVWQFGFLVVLGYGIDPIGILVPFLIFAIGISHGVQIISAISEAVFQGADSLEAARRAVRRLLVPGSVALVSDLVGFVTILLIPVQVIREMAVTASLGVCVVILTDLVLLPVLLSYMSFSDRYRERLKRHYAHLGPVWTTLARLAARGPAAAVIGIALALAIGAWFLGRDVQIGDTAAGVPELRSDSRYNRDSQVITSKFSIGVDILNVIVETEPDGCVKYETMRAIDDFAWHMRNVEGVQSVITLPIVAKVINSGWSEGGLKWRVLPRNRDVLIQSVTYVPTSSGLLNANCSVMPVVMFTADHKAETIARIVAEAKKRRAENKAPGLEFRLATGNVGVMAATNEEVKAKEYPILFGVFGAVIVMCLLTFRSVAGTVCVIVPLALATQFAYAVMTLFGIGLKISTLPMVALGTGIGVDYGIYLFSRMQGFLKSGLSIHDAYHQTLIVTGHGVMLTGVTLGMGVVTWIFSPLKFQADIGILLTFMFLMNMLGAILLLPTLATWLLGEGSRRRE